MTPPVRTRFLLALGAGLLSMVLLCAAAYYYTQTMIGVITVEPYRTRPDGSLRAALAVRVESPQRVLATVTITNCTQQAIALYKPLLCVEGHSEEVFYVQREGRANLSYRGQHADQYVGGTRGPIPLVLPRLDPDLYVQLPAGASHTAVVNLSELFDFEHNRGKFSASYLAYLPVVENGRHVYDGDTHENSPNYPPVPVYYDAESGFGKQRPYYHTYFEVH